MPLNVIPIARRSTDFDQQVTANGSYTLPKYLFVPDPALRSIGGGYVPAPGGTGSPGVSQIIGPTQFARPYPTPDMGPVWGLRSITVKTR